MQDDALNLFLGQSIVGPRPNLRTRDLCKRRLGLGPTMALLKIARLVPSDVLIRTILNQRSQTASLLYRMARIKF